MAERDLPPPPALPKDAALFLDFDGTLVELAETPDRIAVPRALHPLLERIAERLDGRLAIVTGRAVADLGRYVRAEGLAVSGSHGLELRRADGREAEPPASPALAEAREAVAEFAKAQDGMLAEEKPASIALHFRQAPEAAGEAERFMGALARRTGLALQHGKMVIEIRPAGADKGDAIRTLMREPPFAGARPWFVGDDLTDEHGFEAAAGMGGAGILVGPARDTTAHYRLGGVAEVIAWLEKAVG
jgi:trehalose 6-phosphate phosphatase